MGHSSVRIKVRRRKVAALAAFSRQFTVNNSAIPQTDLNKKNVITMWREIRTTKYDTPVYGKMFEVDENGGYHCIIVDHSWEQERHKQPKRLIKCKKRKYSDFKSYSNQHGEKTVKREKRNDFVDFFPNYPYTIKPMSKEAYWEKLVAHKLAKWEKKNPKPNQDLFESTEEWKQKRFVAEQRFRDFVVSGYNKLNVTATITKPGGPPYEDIIIGKVNDYSIMKSSENNGDRTIKEAKEIAMKAMKKNPDILHCQIENFKGEKYRLVA